jgi:hypothetical protein
MSEPSFPKPNTSEENREKLISSEREYISESVAFLEAVIARSQGEHPEGDLTQVEKDRLDTVFSGKLYPLDEALRELEDFKKADHGLSYEDIGFTQDEIVTLREEISAEKNVLMHDKAEMGLTGWRAAQTGRMGENLKSDAMLDLALAVFEGDLDIDNIGLTTEEQLALTARIDTAKEEAIRRYNNHQENETTSRTRMGRVDFGNVKKLIRIGKVTAEELGVDDFTIESLKSDLPTMDL